MSQTSFIKMALPMAIASVLSLSGCSDSSDSITDSEETFTINMSGGNGGHGGNGGYLSIDKYKIGHLKILKTQKADASFTPLVADGYMGTAPLIISEDITLVILGIEDPRPAAGTPYFISGSTAIYLSTGIGFIGDEESNGDIATGVTINTDVTLTLPDNTNENEAYISLENDLVNNGTINTVNIAESTNRPDITLYVASYIGSGSIDNSGQTPGQSGGGIQIEADYSILNHGNINSSGANDDETFAAGQGGSVYLEANSRLENTATINSSGGTSTNETHAGGNAGDLELYASGDTLNSGDLLAQGGDGITAGGDADNIYIESWYTGNVKNSGNLKATGGNATAGNAGNGSSIYFEAENADLINSGDISTAGGSTTAVEGNGGYGGRIDFDDTDDDSLIGDFIISGNMDTSGGNTATDGTGSAGNAGGLDIEIENEDSSIASSRKIILYGYTSIITKGGDGVLSGGEGGDFYAQIDIDHDDAEYIPVAVTNTDMVNEA
ncbi:MAG: hypothetical protein KAQ67_00490, partial [Gammaproteobacteria bacterium]|nr:hypothetical protein [Gammaproteobacteria bacterium]